MVKALWAGGSRERGAGRLRTEDHVANWANPAEPSVQEASAPRGCDCPLFYCNAI